MLKYYCGHVVKWSSKRIVEENMRKRQIVSLVLAILMCFCMINVAFAQEKNSVEGFTLGPNYSITETTYIREAMQLSMRMRRV